MAISGGHTVGTGDHVGDHNLLDAAVAAAVAASNSGSYLFSSLNSSISASGTVLVSTAITVGACRLSVTGAPAGSNLVVVLQKSPDGTTWSTVQSLTITAGSTTAVTATPAAAVAATNLLRVNATSVGSGTAATGVVYQADYA